MCTQLKGVSGTHGNPPPYAPDVLFMLFAYRYIAHSLTAVDLLNVLDCTNMYSKPKTAVMLHTIKLLHHSPDKTLYLEILPAKFFNLYLCAAYTCAVVFIIFPNITFTIKYPNKTHISKTDTDSLVLVKKTIKLNIYIY